MCALAGFQDWPDVGVKWLSAEEENRVMAYPIPGDDKLGSGSWGSRATYYPRKPVESVWQWRANHAAKLRSLELAAGMDPSVDTSA